MRGRWKLFAISAGAAISLATTAVWPPRPLVLWNTTASAPEGFYRMRATSHLKVGDLVVAGPPKAFAAWFEASGFLPRGVPLLKQVLALDGQHVCRRGAAVLVDDRLVARARTSDRFGRPLPSWSGCTTLRADEVLLLNPAAPDSLDGRYFGPSPRRDVVARVTPLWTWEGR